MKQQSSHLLGWLIAGGVTLMLTGTAITSSAYTGQHEQKTYILFNDLIWLPFLIATSATFAAVIISPLCSTWSDRISIDSPPKLTQWTTTSGGVILLYTGINIGFLCFPRFAESTENLVMFFNLHFVGALLFIFGCIFWASNLFVETRSPHKKQAQASTHYCYFTRLASLTIITTVAAVLLSGFIKVFSRLVDFSPNIIDSINLIHGAATLVLLLLIPVHVFLSSLLSQTLNKSLKGFRKIEH